jgi:hypothetical protein
MGSRNNLVVADVGEYLPSQDAPVYVAAAGADSPENFIEECRQGEGRRGESGSREGPREAGSNGEWAEAGPLRGRKSEEWKGETKNKDVPG